MGKRHLTLKDRAELEALYNKGSGVEEIAAKLKVHRSTVYNELKRGDTGEMDSNGRIGYSAELAQQEIINNYRRRRTACCLLYTSPSPRDRSVSRMPSSA